MIIGISGFGYTASSAVFSLFAEFSNVTTYGTVKNDFEFNITYAPDGLEDLEYNLCINPSKGVRCDIAIYRFLNYVKAYKKSFNRLTNNNFETYTNEFLDNLISTKFIAYRTFEYERNPRRVLNWKLRGLASRIFNKFGLNVRTYPKRQRYLSIFPEDYLNKAKSYVSKLLGYSNDTNKIMVVNQPFSANNPLNSMKFFDNPKCIIVDRDPRDLYVMLKHVYGVYGMFIPTQNIDDFIDYYKKTRDDRLYKSSQDVLIVKFEDLIYEYEETVSKIKKFIGEDLGEHSLKRQLFNPDFSIKNVNVFESYPEEKENIEKIEKELSNFLYNFEGKQKATDKSELSKFTLL